MDNFDVTMRQAADLGAATFLLRAYVAGEVDEFVRRRAASWVAEHTTVDPAAYMDNPLDHDLDDDSEDCDDGPCLCRPGSRLLYAEGLL